MPSSIFTVTKCYAYKEWQQLFKKGKLNEVQEQFFKIRNAEALYDIETDPHEIHNLATDPSYESTLKELRSYLHGQLKAMPDLSFYPEPYFLEAGLSNPVRFGQENKREIAELIDIANLSLKPFDQSKEEIEKALKANNSWKRYWGLIVCSSFGQKASPFFEIAKEIVMGDKENLVRLRAVEFLMLNDQEVRADLIVEILKNAETEVEANLILNSIALLKMEKPGFEINIPKRMFPSAWTDQEGDLVNRRLDFIAGNN